MKRTNKKRNRNTKTLFYLIVLLILGIVFWTLTNLSKTYDIEVIKYGEIIIENNVMGLAIREEQCVLSPSHGSVLIKSEEGKRVSKGEKVLSIYIPEDIGVARKKLTEIEEKIDNYINSTDIVDEVINNDIETLDSRIDILENKLSSSTEEDQESILIIEKQIQDLNEKKIEIIKKSKYSNNYFKELLDEREELLDLQKKVVTELFAIRAGIISYIIDGYEDILSPKNVDEFKAFDVNNVLDNYMPVEPFDAAAGKPVYKIIDNHKLYVAFVIKNNDIYFIKEGDIIEVGSGENYSESVNASVYKINKELEESVVTLKINIENKHIVGNRILDMKVIFKSYEGLKVPLNSIVAKGDKHGIYLMQSGEPVYRIIKIIGRDEKYAIIEGVDRPIRHYSNVITNPWEIDESLSE